MSLSQVAIPVPTKLFLAVIDRLKEQSSDRDPVDAIHYAIEVWLQTGAPRGVLPRLEDLKNEKFDIEQPNTLTDGYWWKSVFLPKGTKVRMSYRGRLTQTEVTSEGIAYQGQSLSPSEFTHRVTNTNRNAWRDIELLFPDSQHWISADTVRQNAKS